MVHWRHLTILKTSNKSVWTNVFWYLKVCIFWKFIQYTMRWDKLQILKKFPSNKVNSTKNVLYFLSWGPSQQVLLLICHWCMNWRTTFVSLKLRHIFHFRFRLVFIIKLFFSAKYIDFLTLKRHNSFQS